MMILTTERLILRPWEEAYASALFDLARDARIGPMAGWNPHKDAEESLEIIRAVFSAPETYAVCRRVDGALMGCVGLKQGENTDLTDSPREGELGYWMGVPYWGRGYMTEAVKALMQHCFRDLGLTKLWCGYYDGNHASRRVQEKCGFRYDHTRENVFVGLLNTYKTEHVGSIAAEEWA